MNFYDILRKKKKSTYHPHHHRHEQHSNQVRIAATVVVIEHKKQLFRHSSVLRKLSAHSRRPCVWRVNDSLAICGVTSQIPLYFFLGSAAAVGYPPAYRWSSPNNKTHTGRKAATNTQSSSKANVRQPSTYSGHHQHQQQHQLMIIIVIHEHFVPHPHPPPRLVGSPLALTHSLSASLYVHTFYTVHVLLRRRPLADDDCYRQLDKTLSQSRMQLDSQLLSVRLCRIVGDMSESLSQLHHSV